MLKIAKPIININETKGKSQGILDDGVKIRDIEKNLRQNYSKPNGFVSNQMVLRRKKYKL